MSLRIIGRGAAIGASILLTLGAVGLTAAPASAAGGINNWNCRTDAQHPQPVVLAHGLGANTDANWFYHGPKLAAAGYCVYTFTYGTGVLGPGVGGIASMRDSAAELKTFVDRVRSTTGAAEVDIVGHSEGTTITAYYLKFLGGADAVESFVGFGSNFKGTTLGGFKDLAKAAMTIPVLGDAFIRACGACAEYLPPSQFLDDLAAGGFTVPGVRYTSIISRYDTVVVPYTSGRIDEPGVKNIVLQDACKLDFAGHLAMAIDPNVTSLIRANLGSENHTVRCVPFFAPA